MEKLLIPHDSYAYENFTTVEETSELRSWMFKLLVKGELSSNETTETKSRFWAIVKPGDDTLKPPKVFYTVKERVMELESLEPANCDEYLNDFISINLKGAIIHHHIDPNREGCIHTRYNLIVSMPEKGGNPIYGDQVIDYQERMLWRCEAGKYYHTSVETEGKKPRMNISFGFQIPIAKE